MGPKSFRGFRETGRWPLLNILLNITACLISFLELQCLSLTVFWWLAHYYLNLAISPYRMENTQICEQIIKDFNGQKIPGTINVYLMQGILGATNYLTIICNLKFLQSTTVTNITAPFNNIRTPEFKAQPTNAFFTTVNQLFGGSSQLPTMLCKRFDLITAHSAVVRSWEELPNI